MNRQLSNQEIAILMSALEGLALDSDHLHPESKRSLLKLADDLARSNVWLSPH